MAKIHLRKKLSSIHTDDKGVTVTCADGTSYRGTLVLGADGVHSATRRIMRKMALKSNPSKPWDAENPYLASYRCLWCSLPTPAQAPKAGSSDTQHKDRSVMFVSGRKRSWIFLYTKLPEPTRERVSYTEKDLEACVEEFADFHVTGDLKVKDVWATRLTAGMSNLDEGVVNNWTWGGRSVLAGDAAHKFTPNSGEGFNNGIADLVRLLNGLKSAQSSLAAAPAEKQMALLAGTLAAYETERRAEIQGEIKRAAAMTRMHAWANPLYYFGSRYIMSSLCIQWLVLQTLVKWNISSGRVLDFVKADEPFQGAVQWKYPLKEAKRIA